MVKHIVTFKLQGTPQQRQEVALKFKSALEALPAVIPCLRSIEVGLKQNPAESWDAVPAARPPPRPGGGPAALLADHKEARACVDYEF